jgi:hypothetical protein
MGLVRSSPHHRVVNVGEQCEAGRAGLDARVEMAGVGRHSENELGVGLDLRGRAARVEHGGERGGAGARRELQRAPSTDTRSDRVHPSPLIVEVRHLSDLAPIVFRLARGEPVVEYSAAVCARLRRTPCAPCAVVRPR